MCEKSDLYKHTEQLVKLDSEQQLRWKRKKVSGVDWSVAFKYAKRQMFQWLCFSLSQKT